MVHEAGPFFYGLGAVSFERCDEPGGESTGQLVELTWFTIAEREGFGVTVGLDDERDWVHAVRAWTTASVVAGDRNNRDLADTAGDGIEFFGDRELSPELAQSVKCGLTPTVLDVGLVTDRGVGGLEALDTSAGVYESSLDGEVGVLAGTSAVALFRVEFDNGDSRGLRPYERLGNERGAGLGGCGFGAGFVWERLGPGGRQSKGVNDEGPVLVLDAAVGAIGGGRTADLFDPTDHSSGRFGGLAPCLDVSAHNGCRPAA